MDSRESSCKVADRERNQPCRSTGVVGAGRVRRKEELMKDKATGGADQSAGSGL